MRHPNERGSENVKLAELGDAEEARTSSDGLLKNDDDDMVQLIASYQRRSASPKGVRYDPSHRISDDHLISILMLLHPYSPELRAQPAGRRTLDNQ